MKNESCQKEGNASDLPEVHRCSNCQNLDLCKLQEVAGSGQNEQCIWCPPQFIPIKEGGMPARLNDALDEFRSFRRTLSPSSQAILNAGLIGRLLGHIPEDIAINAIHQSMRVWMSQQQIKSSHFAR